MSSLSGPFCRQCIRSFASTLGRTHRMSFIPPSIVNPGSSTRNFSSTPLALARKPTKKSPSKKHLALLARIRARKREKGVYAQEKMTLADAINVLRAVEVARPSATYELVIRTAMPRGTPVPTGRINLPREAKPRKEYRILVFADGRQADEARRAGAHVVGGLELVEAVAEGKHNNCTNILCTASLIRGISGRLGRILGPRGLMPSERRGTVTDDIEGYIERLSGTTEWRGDKTGNIRMPVGKMHFPIGDVVKNVKAFLLNVKRATGNIKDAVTEAETKAQRGKNKNKSVKPVNPITRILLSSSQAPGIQIKDL